MLDFLLNQTAVIQVDKTILSTFAEASQVRTNTESMLEAFLDCEGIVSTGQRINQHYYKEVLQGLTKQVL
jgi:hypothetical protein